MKPGFHAFCDLNCEHQCHKRKLWWNKHKISTLKYDAMAYSIITGPLAAGNNNNINRNVNKHILLCINPSAREDEVVKKNFQLSHNRSVRATKFQGLVKGPESSWVFNTVTIMFFSTLDLPCIRYRVSRCFLRFILEWPNRELHHDLFHRQYRKKGTSVFCVISYFVEHLRMNQC